MYLMLSATRRLSNYSKSICNITTMLSILALEQRCFAISARSAWTNVFASKSQRLLSTTCRKPTIPIVRKCDKVIHSQNIAIGSQSEYNSLLSTQKQLGYSTVTGDDDSWKNVDYDQLMQMIKSKDIQLFDVRTPEEVTETGMMPGATNVPLSEIPDAFKLSASEFKSAYGVDKPSTSDPNIVFSCLGGIRSKRALDAVHDAGFSRARHYPGGWEEYVEILK